MSNAALLLVLLAAAGITLGTVMAICIWAIGLQLSKEDVAASREVDEKVAYRDRRAREMLEANIDRMIARDDALSGKDA